MKSLQTRLLLLPQPGSIERKTRVGRSQPENEYRRRLNDGLMLAFPLFSPRFGLDRQVLYTVSLLTLVAALAGCASQGKPPPRISLDEPVQAQPLPEPPKPVEVVTVPKVLPLPAQMKPLPEADEAKPAPEPADEIVRVSRANAEARIAPTREGYVNAIQVWPFTDGALYQVYAAPGRVTVISLQPGEELVTVAAGDTVRWIVGDTSSGAGNDLRVNVLVKPIRSGLKTNVVITTSRRTYLIELTSTDKAWMASVSWEYPKDQMLALRRQDQAAQAAAPVDTGLSLEKIRFRYAISGSNPPWKPLRAFDDGEKVYIQFPPGIAQGELPPLFVIGAQGDGQLVNYRFRSPYYIVDRLFGAAELRLGGDKGDMVRIERTDGTRGN
ncbi:P-type conjugative transfer protein TrbG [Pseudomonas aeruginosa]|jgi:type IV secretion system protein TrbG|uniref:P-type conjugative transfer protein trbg n=2 Tax=Pseudomonadota TaxID=1224 RepID=A0A1L7NL21_PSEPU|nr:P-type conjugative transfer protein TrbG [Pseudomonas aeruginosa]ERX18221.1 P-type conjugative transfer protein TrbG [Pseudomonas aeruginosa X13273]OWW43220.1 conjugal transfer protein TrbG/VirB9/CagX [Pseudomonas aeruginosa]BAW26112.1 p-type conjugative transfer protein trbg [Pseudomonas putida]